jgi:multidrug efflux system membrane fusion protein
MDRMRTKIIIAACSAVAVALAVGGFAFWHGAAAPVPTQASAPPPVPVVAATVAAHDVPIYLQGVGTVIAYNNVVVRSQITGQITQIAFTQGQTVHKGDLLAQIDPRPFQAQLDQATANRDRDRAQLVNAKGNLDRYTNLQGKGFATDQLVETQKAQFDQLQAMIKSDEAVIESAQVNLAYTRLTAPIDGVTGIRQIDEGNVIHPTDAAGLVTLTQIQPISLIFTLPETTLTAIQQELAQGPVKVFAYSQDDKTQLDEGSLLLIDNQIIQTTGTIRLRATFPNAKRLLWPGELVNVRLLLRMQHDGLTVASQAVQQGPNGSYLYVIGSDQTVQIRPVTVGQVSQGQTLIESGLKDKETIVVAGQSRLQPGAHVQILHGRAAQQTDLQNAVQQAIP